LFARKLNIRVFCFLAEREGRTYGFARDACPC